jgi:hypothetical protein
MTNELANETKKSWNGRIGNGKKGRIKIDLKLSEELTLMFVLLRYF